jgi:hypothetical protein
LPDYSVRGSASVLKILICFEPKMFSSQLNYH